MKNYEKILLTLVIITFWLPFIFENSEVRLQGTSHEYINKVPNMQLLIIPYALASIWFITLIWRNKKK